MEQFPDHVAEASMHGVSSVFSGASLEQLAEFIRPALEFAAADGKPSVFLGIMKIVVRGGAQLAGYRGEGGRTLFDAAALGGCADIVSSLLRAGARPDLNVVSASSGRSALYLAASLGHEEAACCLARAGADVNFHDPEDRCGVLAKAADKGLGELAGLLLVGGADPTAEDNNGYSPLHLGSRSGSVRVVKALLEQGVDLDDVYPHEKSPLFMAAHAGHPDVVTTLLDAGANGMFCVANDGSAFSVAASKGDVSVLEALFKGCTPSIGMVNRAIEMAVMHGFAVAIDMLVKTTAANVNDILIDEENYCLEWGAVYLSHLDTVRTLLRHGALVDHNNDGTGTCLQLACCMKSEGLPEIVDVLLRNGADETETESGFFSDLEKRGSPLQILEGCGWSVRRFQGLHGVRCSPEEKERARVLLVRAPNDRAWRRRSWLVMLRSQALKASVAEADAHGGTTKATKADQEAGVRDQAEGGNAGFGGVVVFLLGLSAEGVFRNVLGFL